MTELVIPLESGVWSGYSQGVDPGDNGVHGRREPRDIDERTLLKVMLLFDETAVIGHGTEGWELFRVTGCWGESDLFKPTVHEFVELALWESEKVAVMFTLSQGKHEAVCHCWLRGEELVGFWRRETN